MKQHRHLPARAYQRRDDPTKLIAEDGRAAVQKAVAGTLRAYQQSIPADALVKAIKAHDYLGAENVVNVDGLKQRLATAFEPIANIHNTSAKRSASEISAALVKARRMGLRKDTTNGNNDFTDPYAFDLFSQEVLDALRNMQEDFITDMTDNVREQVYKAVIDGVRLGLDPQDIATQIRDTIGLTDRQATAVANYRAALENGSSSALDRALRDGGADAEVQAAIDAGVVLSDERIDELVDAYIDRSLDYRADMIAQTESNRAANKGLQTAYQQAISRGVMPDDAVRQYWMVSLDERTCPVCAGIAEDYPDGIAMDELFSTDDGDISQPPVHPNCRCSLEIRTNLDMVSASGAQIEQAMI